MNIILIILIVVLPLFAGCSAKKQALTEAEKDILITNLTGTINDTAHANFLTACINVTREVKRKHIAIYAVHAASNAEIITESGFEIEIIYHPDLSNMQFKQIAGAYFEHHNYVVLGFAASEFKAGRKPLALQIIKLLTKVDPKMEWSSPNSHGLVPVSKILSALQSGDGSMNGFLESASDQWKWIAKSYSPRGE